MAVFGCVFCISVKCMVNLSLCLPGKVAYLMCMGFPAGKNLSVPQAVVSVSCFYNYPCKQELCPHLDLNFARGLLYADCKNL